MGLLQFVLHHLRHILRAVTGVRLINISLSSKLSSVKLHSAEIEAQLFTRLNFAGSE
jgi:hypothetical protein